MRLIFVSMLMIMSAYAFCQVDSLLTFREYITIVKEDHPVMFQANLLTDAGITMKRIARGGFDPKLEGGWDQKSFDGKNYYSLGGGSLKIPTWYGVEVKAGYEYSSGVFLNDSNKLPTSGLWHAGISVPVGRGFILDERRAELKRADLYISMNEQERALLINDVLYQATTTYLDWQVSFALVNIAAEGQQLAEARLSGTRSSFINGDKPAIDTLESFISLQSRQLDYQKALQGFQNAAIALNNYMWVDGSVPLEVEDFSRPEDMDVDLLSNEVNSISLRQDMWIASHPELLLYDYKLDNIAIDQRLAREDLKPDLRVNYNPLLSFSGSDPSAGFNPGNYKIGAALYYPIVQRKERGKIQLNRLKIRETEYARTLKNQELGVKLDTYINNINQTQQQYSLLNATVVNYGLMLRAENRKLSVGESSIFLVNSRENKYLESRYKEVELSQKLLINRITYLLYSVQLERSL